MTAEATKKRVPPGEWAYSAIHQAAKKRVPPAEFWAIVKRSIP